MSEKKYLFARIGYMVSYDGYQTGDDKILGGGDYNKKEDGHEIYNFRDVNGSLYGYVQPYDNSSSKPKVINIPKISPDLASDQVSGVTVIFFARDPIQGGQFILGWYKRADVYAARQQATKKHNRNTFPYYLKASTSNAVLLPTSLRSHQVAGKGLDKTHRPGQANAFYIYSDTKGTEKGDPWIQGAIDYVESYQGPNLLSNAQYEDDKAITYTTDALANKHSGQGFQINTSIRLAVERYAMDKAKAYFESQGYVFIKDLSGNHSIDLKFEKGGEPLFVEVKGTQSKGESVFLTRNEVKLNSAGEDTYALYILHSIKVSKHFKCSRGTEIAINPWKLNEKDLTVVTYQYKVPSPT